MEIGEAERTGDDDDALVLSMLFSLPARAAVPAWLVASQSSFEDKTEVDRPGSLGN